MTIDHRHAGVTVGAYYVAGFVPMALPATAVLSTSDCNLGTPDITDPVSDALSRNIGSTSRWLADPAKLTDHGDGTWRWVPSAGSLLTSFWEFPAANVCVTNPTYAYRLKHGREITKPAFVFQGDMWAQLKSFPDGLAACTVLMVARLRRPAGAARSGIVESRQSGTDPAGQSDIYYRLKHNHMHLGVKGHHREEFVFNTRRPHILGASHDTSKSRMVQVAVHRHLKEFRHPSVSAYDMTWYLARLGGTYDADQTTVMDVCEINIWDSALTGEELRRACHQLNGIYAVTG